MTTDRLRLYREDAEAAAMKFCLPADWMAGRALRHDIAIDGLCSPDIDDAVAYSENSSGHTLHVSVSDLASFIARNSPMERYASLVLDTEYKDDAPARPMFPREVSENKLSLLHGQLRPATTVHMPITSEGTIGGVSVSRTMVASRQYTYEDVNTMLRSPEEVVAERREDLLMLQGLSRITDRLFSRRHSGRGLYEGSALENEVRRAWFGDVLYSPSQLIVQESMIAANVGMAMFFTENNIPFLHRCFFEGEIEDGALPFSGWLPIPRAFYSAKPQPHTILGLPKYTHFTSPIRRFADFVSHANLVAWLEGRPFPYDDEALEEIAARYYSRYQRRQGSRQKLPPSEPRQPKAASSGYLLSRFTSGEANQSDVTMAIFWPQHGEEVRQQLNAAAADYIQNNPATVDNIVRTAIAKNLLPAQITHDRAGKPYFILEAAGKNFPFGYKGKYAERIEEAMALLSHQLGITIEARPDRDNLKYLRLLDKQGRIALSFSSGRDSDGIAHVELLVRIGDDIHTVAIHQESAKAATRRAATEMIERLDLFANVPPVMPQEKWSQSAQKRAERRARYQAECLAKEKAASENTDAP